MTIIPIYHTYLNLITVFHKTFNVLFKVQYIITLVLYIVLYLGQSNIVHLKSEPL